MSPSQQATTLLANRPFVLLLAGRTTSMLGMAFSPVALAFGLLQLPDGGPATLSIVLAAQTVPMVIFMLVGGVVADRYPRRLVLLTGELLAALGWGAIGVMLLTGYAPIVLLSLAAALAGMSSALIYPALSGIIPDLVSEDMLQPANSWLAMGASVARLAGLVAAGAVVVWLGGGWAMVTAGSLFALAGLLMMRLPAVTGTLAGAEDHPIRQLIEGWGEFKSRQWLWVCVVQWSMLILALQAAHGVLGPVVAEQELGGAAAWTTILAGEAVGAMIGVAISLVWHPHRPILVGTLLTGTAALPPILLAVSAPLWVVTAAMGLQGIGFELFGVLWLTTMQNEVPPEALSRVASYDALGSLMLGPVGLLLAGPATLAFGVHLPLLVTGLLAFATMSFALAFPEVRQLRSRLASAVADDAVASPSVPLSTDPLIAD